MAVGAVLCMFLLAGLTDCQTLSIITAVVPGTHSVGSSITLMADFTPNVDEYTIIWSINDTMLLTLFMPNVSNITMDREELYPNTRTTILEVSYEHYTRKMKLTIVDLLLEDNNSIVQAKTTHIVEKPLNETFTLEVSECLMLCTEPQTFVQYSIGRKYNSTTMYNCSKGSLYVNNTYDDSYTQTCNVSAKWNPPTVGECWFSPSSVNVSQNTYFENESLSLSCNSSNDGYPNTTGFEYFFNNITLTVLSQDLNTANTSKKLMPDDYNSTYTCRVVSDYTSVNKSDGFSDDRRLIVFFGPKEVEHTPPTHIPMNQSEEVFIYIKANDKSNNLTVYMSKNGRNVSLELNQTLTHHNDIFYNYSYFIKIKSIEDYGDYVFNAYTSLPIDSLSVVITISGSKKGPVDSGQLSLGVIIGICGACIAMVFLAIFLLVRCRKHQNNSGDKEERLNPIYDVSSTGAAVAEKEDRVNPLYGGYNESAADKTNVKEERINPLYGSTNEGSSAKKEETVLSNSNIEEAYSTVVKGGGKDNPVFSVGSNDTYTEVKKVNTKKDKNATSSPECMYAEVKKDKPKTKDTNTGLHGSTNATTAK